MEQNLDPMLLRHIVECDRSNAWIDFAVMKPALAPLKTTQKRVDRRGLACIPRQRDPLIATAYDLPSQCPGRLDEDDAPSLSGQSKRGRYSGNSASRYYGIIRLCHFYFPPFIGFNRASNVAAATRT